MSRWWNPTPQVRTLLTCVAVGGIAFASAACTAVMTGGPENGMSTGGSSGGAYLNQAGSMSQGGVGPQYTGYKSIHRLSNFEYNATVSDVLQTALQPANGSWRVYELNGFDNMADVQLVDTDQYQRYFDAAGTLADDAFARADFKAKLVTCATPDDACVSGIVGKIGLKLFRRPLAQNEVTNYKAVYTAATGLGETHEGAIKQVLRALLASSEFLYRMEFDADPSSVEKHPLSPYELATRLSYLLWSSAPDDTLMAAAADSSITADATLKSNVDRMLADPVRSERFVESFYGQWLGGRRVAEHAVAPDVYAAWTPDLGQALANEMYAYFSDFLKTDRSWLEFLTADENFVNGPIAALYGMQAPASATGLSKVTDTTDQRKGFLGLGGFLAQSSLDRRTSPTLRGRWIMINLLCTQPPAPPKDVPKIEVAAGMTDLSKGNVRAVLEKHRANAVCASCHAMFDPYGLPLEQFDGIGAYRATYKDGSAVDPSTKLIDGTQLAGLDQLASALTADSRFKQCVADNLFSYSLGRALLTDDRPALDTIQAGWNNGQEVPSLRRLIDGVVLGQSFRTRSGRAAP